MCVILHEPVYYWSHYHIIFFPVQHYITVSSLLGLALFVNLVLNFENILLCIVPAAIATQVHPRIHQRFVLIPNIWSFCTFILVLYFVVSSSLFFPYLIYPVECSLQKVHRVFLSLSQSWSTINSIFLSFRSNRNTSHPWPIHTRVANWKIPKHFFANSPVDKPWKCCFSCRTNRTRLSACLKSYDFTGVQDVSYKNSLKLHSHNAL